MQHVFVDKYLGGGVLFRSEMFLRTTQKLEYLIVSSRKAQFFFQNLTLGYMTSDYYSFLPPKSEFFFQQHWESEYLTVGEDAYLH
jgi:hypothetical protein